MAIPVLIAACRSSPQDAWLHTLTTLPVALSSADPVDVVTSSVVWWTADSVALLDERAMQIVVRSLRDGGERRIGRRGSGPGEFTSVAALAVGETRVFVADPVSAHVAVLSRTGDHVANISASGVPLELLRWSSDTAALFLYKPAGAIGGAGTAALLAERSGSWAIVSQRSIRSALPNDQCPRRAGTRAPYEPPVAGAANGRLISLDPFTLGGLTSSWADSLGTPLPALCPPLGPMSRNQRERHAAVVAASTAGLTSAQREAVANALRAYAGLTQPIALASRLSHAADGRWWLPLDLPSAPGALLGLGGDQPLVLRVPEHILDVDWQPARTDSLIGVVLVRNAEDALFLRRLASPLMPLRTTRP